MSEAGEFNNQAGVGQDELLQRLGQLLERSNLQPGDINHVQSLRVSDWEVVTKGEDGEPVINQLHGTQALLVPKGLEENPFITQAAPTVINSSEVTPVKRDHELIAVLPDIQYGFRHTGNPYKRIDRVTEGEQAEMSTYEPLHDPRALHVAQMVCKGLQPNTIVLQGDLLDFSELSRYEADSPHFADTLQMSINGLHKYLAQLRTNNPNARIVGTAGNHEARLAKSILRHNAQLAGIKPANTPDSWNVLSVPFLLRMDELGIEWHGGYPANQFEHSEGLLFVHGQATRSNGSTASLYSSKYPGENVVFGHIHRSESQSKTDRHGNHHQAISFGTLSRIDGPVPSYSNGVDDKSKVVTHYENWQQGMGLIRVYDDQYLEVQPVRIERGKARINGVEYKAS